MTKYPVSNPADQPFNNDFTPAERRRQFKTDRERRAALLESGEGSTFHGFTTGSDDESGRHAHQTSKMTVGERSIPRYPAAAPWSNDPVAIPDEAPLGYPIDAQEPVGTAEEIAKSLKASDDACGSPSDARDGEGVNSDSPSHGDGAPLGNSSPSVAAPSLSSNDDDPPDEAA